MHRLSRNAGVIFGSFPLGSNKYKISCRTCSSCSSSQLTRASVPSRSLQRGGKGFLCNLVMLMEEPHDKQEDDAFVEFGQSLVIHGGVWRDPDVLVGSLNMNRQCFPKPTKSPGFSSTSSLRRKPFLVTGAPWRGFSIVSVFLCSPVVAGMLESRRLTQQCWGNTSGAKRRMSTFNLSSSSPLQCSLQQPKMVVVPLIRQMTKS